MDKESKEKIQKTIKEFFRKFSFSVESQIIPEEGLLRINLETPEAALIIGRGGSNLLAIQHLLGIIIQKKMGFEKPLKILLDINDYRQLQKEKLEKMAKKKAEIVLKYKRPEVLPPMTSYERRIVHLALADQKGIITESVGEEPNRRIIIRISEDRS